MVPFYFRSPYVMFVVLFVLYSRVEGPISPYNVSVGRDKWAWSVNIRSVHTWICRTVACLDAPHVILACCLDDLPCVKLVFWLVCLLLCWCILNPRCHIKIMYNHGHTEWFMCRCEQCKCRPSGSFFLFFSKRRFLTKREHLFFIFWHSFLHSETHTCIYGMQVKPTSWG